MKAVTKDLFQFRNILGAIVISVFFVTWGCEKPQSYPPEPEITFKNYDVVDTVFVSSNGDTSILRYVIMKFNFVDGDGDLSGPGERPLTVIDGDTIGDTTTYAKIFYELYFKVNGQYEVSTDTLTPREWALPYKDVMAREGQNKTQKGEMQFQYLFFITKGTIIPDTIRFDFYLTDMAFHRSNTLQVFDIPLKGRKE